MKTTLTLLVLFALTIYALQPFSQTNYERPARTVGFIEKLDDELDQVLDVQAVPEIIGEGYQWSEGPVWVDNHQFLLFSDVPSNKVHKWTREDGMSVYLEPSGYTGNSGRGGEMGSNGLIIDHEGSLIISQHGNRAIARMNAPLNQPSESYTLLADNHQGNKLNSPNDVVQHSNGDLYFTDPPYGLENGADDPLKELDYHGVYRVNTDGDVILLTDELSRPNGLAFSQDEKTLYVANSDPDRAIWMAYDVADDGSITNGRIFHDATGNLSTDQGLPDGLKVNSDGYLFATGPGGVWIFAPDARVLGKIRADGELVSNCALGNEENMLYMTADSYVLSLAL
ncbi:MAG: SMP-30/gluconolactonase/LRE family protein [Balneolales bacterium]